MYTQISYKMLNIWIFNWIIALVSSYACLKGNDFIWYICTHTHMDSKCVYCTYLSLFCSGDKQPQNTIRYGLLF